MACPMGWQSPMAAFFSPMPDQDAEQVLKWSPSLQPCVLENDCHAEVKSAQEVSSLQPRIIENDRQAGKSAQAVSSQSEERLFAVSCALEDTEVPFLPLDLVPDTMRGIQDHVSNHPGWHLPDQYKLGSHVGAGSYGSVCEAWDLKEQKRVAVKKIERVFRNKTHGKRILREVAILSQLQHSHIVRIYDLPKPDNFRRFDDLYIIMERCDTDLQKVCAYRPGITLPQARKLAYGLLVGCRYLHSAGVFHRDLKPANCLVNRDCSLKICDFNLACTVEAREDSSQSGSSSPECADDVPLQRMPLRRSLTKHVASRWYRSPEVLLQLEYSQAMDVWSAGCIIAEIFGALSSKSRRSPLFPGDQCYPLSAGTSDAELNGDQLDVILDVLGTPSDDEINSIPSKEAQARLKSYDARSGCGIREKMPAAVGEEGICLLEDMLRFIPNQRISMTQALQYDFFAMVQRSLDEKKVACRTLHANFDETSASDGMWLLELRHQVQTEIGKFHTW